MKRNNLYLLFPDFKHQYFYKDVFNVPYFLGNLLQINDINIVYPVSEEIDYLPKQYKGVNLKAIQSTFMGYNIPKTLVLMLFLIKVSRKISFLMLFHFSKTSLFLFSIYKIFNSKGEVYLKLDGEMWVDKIILGEKDFIKKIFYKKILKEVKIISIESKAGYDKLKSYFERNSIDCMKLRYLPNGIDCEEFDRLKITEKSFEEKENIIITVGRIGAFVKNNEMLLRATSMLDLADWKVVFIGEIEQKENDFHKQIENFYKDYPNLKEKVIFTGRIDDRKELYEWYNRAKIFILTSLSESFSIPLIEAAWFNLFILSTDVGFFKDLQEYANIEKIKQNDSFDLAQKLQKLIDNGLPIEQKKNPRKFSYKKLIGEMLRV